MDFWLKFLRGGLGLWLHLLDTRANIMHETKLPDSWLCLGSQLEIREIRDDCFFGEGAEGEGLLGLYALGGIHSP